MIYFKFLLLFGAFSLHCATGLNTQYQGAGILLITTNPITKIQYFVLGYGVGGFSDYGGSMEKDDANLQQLAIRECKEESAFQHTFTEADLAKAISSTTVTSDQHGERTEYTMRSLEITWAQLLLQKSDLKNNEKHGTGLVPLIPFMNAVKNDTIEQKKVQVLKKGHLVDEDRYFFAGYRIRKAFLEGCKEHFKQYTLSTEQDSDPEIIMMDDRLTALEKSEEFKRYQPLKEQRHRDFPKKRTHLTQISTQNKFEDHSESDEPKTQNTAQGRIEPNSPSFLNWFKSKLNFKNMLVLTLIGTFLASLRKIYNSYRIKIIE